MALSDMAAPALPRVQRFPLYTDMRNSPIKDLRVRALFTTNSGIPTVPAPSSFSPWRTKVLA